MEKFVYVTYISSTPRKIWQALIDPKLTAKYWGHDNISSWKRGAKWEHRRSGKKTVDLVGKVVEFSPPRRLVVTWAHTADEARKDRHSRVKIEIAPYRTIARLTVTHDRLRRGSDMLEGITYGWPIVLSSLKTLLETRRPLPKLW
jgi:uncharacterized protein YndB with AHSA1/START domain